VEFEYINLQKKLTKTNYAKYMHMYLL